MPNIKSAIKRVEVTKVKTINNTAKKSALKTDIRKAKEAIASKDSSAAENVKKAAVSIDKAAAKKLIHKNTAARKKSRIAKALNAASK
ncbi:MAG: 30S ribosomal protein S20 [Bacillota bacterium]|nr:30S ribosomal protein S20 [Bacillota bacterium]